MSDNALARQFESIFIDALEFGTVFETFPGGKSTRTLELRNGDKQSVCNRLEQIKENDAGANIKIKERIINEKRFYYLDGSFQNGGSGVVCKLGYTYEFTTPEYEIDTPCTPPWLPENGDRFENKTLTQIVQWFQGWNKDTYLEKRLVSFKFECADDFTWDNKTKILTVSERDYPIVSILYNDICFPGAVSSNPNGIYIPRRSIRLTLVPPFEFQADTAEAWTVPQDWIVNYHVEQMPSYRSNVFGNMSGNRNGSLFNRFKKKRLGTERDASCNCGLDLNTFGILCEKEANMGFYDGPSEDAKQTVENKALDFEKLYGDFSFVEEMGGKFKGTSCIATTCNSFGGWGRNDRATIEDACGKAQTIPIEHIYFFDGDFSHIANEGETLEQFKERLSNSCSYDYCYLSKDTVPILDVDEIKQRYVAICSETIIEEFKDRLYLGFFVDETYTDDLYSHWNNIASRYQKQDGTQYTQACDRSLIANFLTTNDNVTPSEIQRAMGVYANTWSVLYEDEIDVITYDWLGKDLVFGETCGKVTIKDNSDLEFPEFDQYERKYFCIEVEE